jgi:hypothetical protein
MRSPWPRVGRVILSVVLSFAGSLAGCSDPDVTFPPVEAGNGDAGGADVSVDARVDSVVDARRSDPDVSSDGCTVCEDVTRDRAETGRPETSGPDADANVPPPDVPDDTVTVDVPDDAMSDPPVDSATDSDDGSHDAVSEEAGTCASRCASGVCDMNGDCTPCVKDDECTGGRVCNAGTCGPRCGDGGVLCTGNLVCCTDHCVDITRDPRHCGMCGMSCPTPQFCGNATIPTCRESLLRNLCDAKKATFLLDGLADDNAASNVVRAAIAANCVPVPVLTSVDQTMSVAINPTTGQPLAGGGELLVAAGGDSWQRHVKYLETSRTSPVYNEFDGVTTLYFKRRGGAPDGGDAVLRVVPLPVSATHDFFVVYVAKDFTSGTFSLVIYGVDFAGTRAGAFYFANVMLPSIVAADVTTFTEAWYLYEWTMADGGAGPSLADTFTQIAAGM